MTTLDSCVSKQQKQSCHEHWSTACKPINAMLLYKLTSTQRMLMVRKLFLARAICAFMSHLGKKLSRGYTLASFYLDILKVIRFIVWQGTLLRGGDNDVESNFI